MRFGNFKSPTYLFRDANSVSIVKIKSENVMNLQINLYAVRAEFKIVRFICDNSSNVRDYMKGRKKNEKLFERSATIAHVKWKYFFRVSIRLMRRARTGGGTFIGAHPSVLISCA